MQLSNRGCALPSAAGTMEHILLTPSNNGILVEHVVNLHVRVQQGRAIAGEIQAIKD